jgi:hypothetical protein
MLQPALAGAAASESSAIPTAAATRRERPTAKIRLGIAFLFNLVFSQALVVSSAQMLRIVLLS